MPNEDWFHHITRYKYVKIDLINKLKKTLLCSLKHECNGIKLIYKKKILGNNITVF